MNESRIFVGFPACDGVNPWETRNNYGRHVSLRPRLSDMDSRNQTISLMEILTSDWRIFLFLFRQDHPWCSILILFLMLWPQDKNECRQRLSPGNVVFISVSRWCSCRGDDQSSLKRVSAYCLLHKFIGKLRVKYSTSGTERRIVCCAIIFAC